MFRSLVDKFRSLIGKPAAPAKTPPKQPGSFTPESRGGRGPDNRRPREGQRDRQQTPRGGPKQEGPRREGPRRDGPRREGPRREGPKREEPKGREPVPHGKPHEPHPPQHAPHPVHHPVWDPATFVVPPAEGKTRFHDMNLPQEIMHALADLDFQYCTPVQAEALIPALKGQDVTAQAQTGTGKTAAFLITIFERFLRNPIQGERKSGTPRALILAPTRELVIQIEKDTHSLGTYVHAHVLSVFGGIDYDKQQNALKRGIQDVLVCTPGRLIDFMRKGLVDLSKVEILVLDEADRMLDMGFIDAVRYIVHSTPPKAERQTMFFSATMTPEVMRLADSWTRNAFDVRIEPDKRAVDTVEQITYITTQAEKPTLLYNLIKQKQLERVLIFVNRKDDARRLKDTLEANGTTCALLSGDVEQDQRIKRLERFREGKLQVLVATNVASRGLHIEGISHVINYNLPQDTEEYIHRIGRTGRAGASGISINFADEYDAYELMKIEELLGRRVPCTYPPDELLTPIPKPVPGTGTPESSSDHPRPHPSGNPRRRRRR